MAPERLRNEPFDGRADIYGLGVILWEMLTCRRLFKGTSDAEIWKNVLEMPVPLPSSVRSDVPSHLDAIVMRMLVRDPANRYEIGRYLADDLEEAVRDTKFKSRHLPRLLGDLFGSGAHSSQFAMAAVSPELLASVAEDNSEVGRRPSEPELLPAESVVPRRRSLKVWGGLAGVMALAGLVVVVGVFSGMGKTAPAKAPFVATPVMSIPPTALAPIAAPVLEASTASVEPQVSKPARAKRPAKSRGGTALGRIASGRSIDPFAEAADRGKR
jgi:serine/threonine protein kinase